MMHYKFYKKSQEFLEIGRKKYDHFFDDLSDESSEARFHLLDYLELQFSYTGSLVKEEGGKPIPIITETGKVLYWSVSHSQNYGAFVVGDFQTGIDIAETDVRDITLLDTHTNEEYLLLGGKCWESFYILWTAKEAIIKSAGGMLDDMKYIVLDSCVTEGIYKFVFQDQPYTIKTIHANTFIVSIVIQLPEIIG